MILYYLAGLEFGDTNNDFKVISSDNGLLSFNKLEVAQDFITKQENLKNLCEEQGYNIDVDTIEVHEVEAKNNRGEYYVAVKNLVAGMDTDLEGDAIADSNKSPDATLKGEYSVVEELKHETESCICVVFQNVTCAFPPEHKVKLSTRWVTDKDDPKAAIDKNLLVKFLVRKKKVHEDAQAKAAADNDFGKALQHSAKKEALEEFIDSLNDGELDFDLLDS